MKNAKKSLYIFLFSLLSQVVTILLGLVIPRITLIGYGSETNGLLNSVTQFVVYLTLFEAGIQAVALQSLYRPVKNNEKQEISEILSAVKVNYNKTGIVYSLGLLSLSILFPFFIKSSLDYLTVFCVVLFSGLGNVVLFFAQGKYKILLQAEGKSYIVTNIQTIIMIITNITKIVLLYLGFNVAVVIFVSFVISLIQAIYIYMYIKKHYKWLDLSVSPNYDALKQNKFALAHQISGLIFQNTDVLILTIVCGLKVVSVYSIYKLIVNHISSLLNIPFNSVSFSLGQLYNTEKDKYSLAIDTVEVLFSTIIFSIYSVVLCLLLPFISLYTQGVTDIEYVDSKIAVLFIIIELLSLIRIPMLNTINFAGHFKNTLSQTIIESIINLTLSIILVLFIGIYGVLIGTVIALLYRTIEIIIYTNKNILNRSSYKTINIHLLNIFILILFVFIYNIFNIDINNFLSFIIIGIILTVISIIVFVSINFIAHRNENKYAIDLIKRIIKNYHHRLSH